jgi:ubiquinone/menaquinone biosynthesis C-methylase UbiE
MLLPLTVYGIDKEKTIAGLALMQLAPLFGIWLKRQLGDTAEHFTALARLFIRYSMVDFIGFMSNHRKALKAGQESGDFVPGVCNYYTLMSDVITMGCGPFWHFVPMFRDLTRLQCHDVFHHTLVKYLGATQVDTILELGCGFGEMGRQVAKISGCRVTGLTMADAEIVGANERIKAEGLADRCTMVQGNYHNLPFEANSFDKVFGIYTLKYSADLDRAIAEAARVLKPGGKFLSYEIIVTDKYDPSDKQQKAYVDAISWSTCMPPLWHARDFRSAAQKAGLVPAEEEDLCAPSDVGAWYSVFERTGLHAAVMKGPYVFRLIQFLEALHFLPKSFSDWFQHCVRHPCTDFVYGGRLGIINGALMMTWTKPQ